MERRSFLKWTAGGAATAALSGCEAFVPLDVSFPEPAGAVAAAGPRIPIIDAHCHVFNAADLPVFPFIRDAFLNADELIGTQLALPFVCSLSDVIQGAAWTAEEELARLNEGTGPRSADEIKMWEMKVLAAVLLNASISGDLLGCLSRRKREKRADDYAPGSAYIDGIATESRRTIRERRFHFQHLLGQLESKDLLRARAQRYYEDDGIIGDAVRWALRFTRYRFENVQDMFDFDGGSNGSLHVLMPALVDFGFWLDDHTTTPIPRQLEVMSAIAGAFKGRVFPFAPFDPWRQAIDQALGKPNHCNSIEELPHVSALAMARYAVEEMGFAGVKVYPPMGFRPIGNADVGLWPCGVGEKRDAERNRDILPLECDRPTFQIAPWRHFPASIRESAMAVFGIGDDPGHRKTDRLIGRELDAALIALYQWSVAQDVPVMAHCRDSQEIGFEYGQRAHPKHWRVVLERPEFRTLRLNLSHFGSMFAMAESLPPKHRNSWAWDVAALADRFPNVYTDVGFFSRLLKDPSPGPDGAAGRFLDQLEAMYRKHPALPEKVMYGSDYSMIGRFRHFDSYPALFSAAYAARFTAGQTADFLAGNASRYLNSKTTGSPGYTVS